MRRAFFVLLSSRWRVRCLFDRRSKLLEVWTSIRSEALRTKRLARTHKSSRAGFSLQEGIQEHVIDILGYVVRRIAKQRERGIA